jgi:hypothetical protein
MRRAFGTAMDDERDESWTIPFQIVIWTTLLLGAIAVLVVLMLD